MAEIFPLIPPNHPPPVASLSPCLPTQIFSASILPHHLWDDSYARHKNIINDLNMQIELKDELASKLKEDKLHFMGLVQEKLTNEEKDTFMKELFNFFENE